MPDLQQAITAIRAGDKETGKQLLIKVIKANPNNETAWLWMTNVVSSDAERVKCLQNAIKINPNSEQAKRGLAALQQRQQPLKVEVPPKPVEPPSEPVELPPLESIVAPQKIEPIKEQAVRSSTRPLKTLKQEATKQCPYCAETIKAEAKVCRFCNRDLITGQQPQAIVPQQPQAPIIIQAQPQRLWSPGVAAVLSLIIPGAGQMYKGQVGKGLLCLIITIIGYSLLIIPGLILHILCVIDASQGNPYGQTNQIRTTTVQKNVPQKKGGNVVLIILIALVVFACCFIGIIGQSSSKGIGNSRRSISTPVSTAVLPSATQPPTPTSTRVVPDTPAYKPTPFPALNPEPYSPAPSSGGSKSCCKVCTTGKACGNSCISVDKTCNKPPGCACNG